MDLSDFAFDLPGELIAQTPAAMRDQSRLLLVDRSSGQLRHARFRELGDLVESDDLFVLNNSRVFPARLFGTQPGRTRPVEVLLLRQKEAGLWEVLLKPARKAPPGTRLQFDEKGAEAVVEEGVEANKRLLRFSVEGDFFDWLDRTGHVPLPPYISRKNGLLRALDRERYQTVFGRYRGSVAAPTAGLHFTERLLSELRYCEITLHVGYGTFKPVKVRRVEDHRMEAELYSIPPRSASAIQTQLAQGKRVIGVGTTSVRTLEDCYLRHNRIVAETNAVTDLFIYPGFDFNVVGAMVTNFHLPCSSLFILACAFAGTELMKDAYRVAIEKRYRFYSYGDAMLIV